MFNLTKYYQRGPHLQRKAMYLKPCWKHVCNAGNVPVCDKKPVSGCSVQLHWSKGESAEVSQGWQAQQDRKNGAESNGRLFHFT